jgi:2-haloacid dehalogenase
VSHVSRTPAAVVFDLGNVLIAWDPHPAVAAGLGDEEATRFLAADDLDFMAWNHQQDLGRSFVDAEDELSRTHPHWHEHALAYRANFGLSLSAMPDNVAVLRDLHAAGVPLFALTNWSAELFPQARARFDFLELFEDIVVSGAERVAKPDPAVYALLERRTGRPLASCVFVDDSAANVEAAATAGLDAVHLTPRVSLRRELRDRGLPV